MSKCVPNTLKYFYCRTCIDVYGNFYLKTHIKHTKYYLLSLQLLIITQFLVILDFKCGLKTRLNKLYLVDIAQI